jgi:hypothetical protein
MNFDDWLQWPTKSTDPGVNFVVLIVLVLLAGFAIVAGFFVAIPVLIVLAIAKGAHWYATRPTPTDQIQALTQQRTIAANFPAPEQFLGAHLRRLRDALDDDYPAFPVFVAMAEISDVLYRTEDLNNPLPPMPSGNTIEEGRYRDRLMAQQRKTMDAPRTLETFNAALGKCYLDFIAGLPPIAKSTPAEFEAYDTTEPFASFR